MPVQIDSMQSQIQILPTQGAGASPATANAAAQSNEQLKELLRPIVIELIGEELETYMRLRG